MTGPAATGASLRDALCIEPAHPALPGHFPGRPVVPGVVLLDAVAAAIERRLGRAVVAVPQAKFLRPLLPGERAELVVTIDGARARFSIVREGTPIATGICETTA